MLVLLCSVLSLFSQPAIHPLSVGESIPDLLLSHLVHYKTPTARLSDFHNEVLILDLMATNCKSCLVHLSHMDTLQQRYQNRLRILPVTYESSPKVRSFLQNMPIGKTISFPFVTEDTLLSQYFPHQFISHLVWIYKGRVVAITQPEYVQAKHIETVLQGKSLFLPVKQDIGHYTAANSLWVPNPETLLPANQAVLRYFSTVTPYLEGFAYGESHFLDTAKRITRTAYINYSIPQLYAAALGKGSRFPAAYVQLEVRDSSRFFFDGKGYKSDWYDRSSYCYQSATPADMLDTLIRAKMQSDLDFYLRLQGRMEKRWVACLILLPDTAFKNATPAITGERIAVSGIAAQLARTPGTPPCFIELPNADRQYVPRLTNWSDGRTLTALLRTYGIQAVTEMRELEMLVISDASPNP